MDLYDNNHEEQIYNAIDFINFVIDNAKEKMSLFYVVNEFKDLSTIEKFKKSVDVLGLYEFKDVINEFLGKIKK